MTPGLISPCGRGSAARRSSRREPPGPQPATKGQVVRRPGHLGGTPRWPAAWLLALASAECGVPANESSSDGGQSVDYSASSVHSNDVPLAQLGAAVARSDLVAIQQVGEAYVDTTACADTVALLQPAFEALPQYNDELLCIRYRLEAVRWHCTDCRELGSGFGYLSEGCDVRNCWPLRSCDVEEGHSCRQ